MQGKGLGSQAAALNAAKLLHSGVPAVVKFFHALAHMAVARLVFAFKHSLYVYPVCRVEHLDRKSVV